MPLFTIERTNVDLIGLGWINDSPLNLDLLNNNHILDFNDIVNRKDIVLITPEPVIKMIITYLHENNDYHLKYKPVIIRNISSSLPEYENVLTGQIKSVHQQL